MSILGAPTVCLAACLGVPGGRLQGLMASWDKTEQLRDVSKVHIRSRRPDSCTGV